MFQPSSTIRVITLSEPEALLSLAVPSEEGTLVKDEDERKDKDKGKRNFYDL